MRRFEEEYSRLNKQQKQAVDNTEGPMMVIAGPGTGKTQLLSMRVANILRKNDISPYNILCLTFTDNAARNMRERLSTIIGQSAYHVSIHTFHSFGMEVINQYPDYFSRRQLLQQIDELGQYEILREIFEELPHSNPLSTKVGDQFVFLKNTLDAISWLKQNALSPEELRRLISSNQKFIKTVSDEVATVFSTIPRSDKMTDYQKLLLSFKKNSDKKSYFGFPHYGNSISSEFETAINHTDTNKKSAPLITAWRNSWCKKDGTGNYVLKDDGQNCRKLHALADIYASMTEDMSRKGLYDFNDMVIEAVHAIEENNELRYNLQERFQYVLVDEFQDTNKAQLRLLAGLGDNPVHENRPNIMTVGDDDQAIYAFQGAEVSNMAIFSKMYDKPMVISLEENYRSTENIISTGYKVAGQIEDRLESLIPQGRKAIHSKKEYEKESLDHLLFPSELAQYDWVAEEIEKLVKKGMPPQEIAVIAPRHKYLERLMPYLGQRNLPIAYERKENILDAPIIIQLLTMSKLIESIAENNQDNIDAYASEVLSYDFWGIDSEKLISISLECYNKHKHWLAVLKDHPDKDVRAITKWFIKLAGRLKLEPMEYMLDQLVGEDPAGIDSQYENIVLPPSRKSSFVSPMRSYYFTEDRYKKSTDSYLLLLGQLSTLRHRLRLWKPDKTLFLKDFVEFAELHKSANLKIIDTNPHTQTTNAVQVMTTYKAKGLEFETVFVINAQDEVWGTTARNASSRIRLPKNLPIEPAGSSDGDKLRLFFVSLTRAKHTLHITSYRHTADNKLSPILSFLSVEDKTLHPSLEIKEIKKPVSSESIKILSTDWAYRFRQVIADKKSLFEPILDNYKLSVTHLNNFLDVRDGGPGYFFTHNLLRFPEALSPSAAYGDSIHKTIQWSHNELRQSGKLPSILKIQNCLSDLLARKHLRKADFKRLDLRGREALELYFHERGRDFVAGDIIERGFNNEGVILHGARLSGKIDKLTFPNDRIAKVIDFKSGKPANSWQGKDEYEKIKLHKYKQQLMFYKLLVENSASFKDKLSVERGEIEFIEADNEGRLMHNLELDFKQQELNDFTRLIEAVWNRIMNLDFPDVSNYPANYKGIEKFEKDLLDKKV